MSTFTSSKTASLANRAYVDMSDDLSTEEEGISTQDEDEDKDEDKDEDRDEYEKKDEEEEDDDDNDWSRPNAAQCTSNDCERSQ
jgi:hypothetical protein